MALNKWVKTKSAIKKLEELLKCNVCGYLLKDPCSINSCDHTFCRACATKAVDSNSKCPECGSFAWLKDLQVNRQLAHIVEFCTSLQHVISKESKDQGSNLIENRDDTLKDVEPDKFLFDSEKNKDRCDNILTDADIGNDGKRVDMMDTGDCHANENLFSAAETKSMLCEQNEQIHTGSNAAEIKSNIIEDVQGEAGDTGRGRKEEHKDAGATIYTLLDDSDEKCEKNEPKRQQMKENHERDANEPNQADPPSWPLSSKKPKKSLRTYSNLKHNKIARKPRLYPLRKDRTSSDIDFEHPAGKNDKEVKSGNSNEALTTHIIDQSKDLFVFDEDKVQEIENHFFHPQKQDGEDEMDLGSNVANANNKRRRPVTRLRRNKVIAEKNDTSVAQASKIKGSKRKSSLTDAENKNPNKGKSDESCAMKRNKKGETPLHLAAMKGNYDVAKELLKNNADPNAKDFAGWTPLHEACNHGRFEIVQLLLDNGALIDIPGCDHDTPLHDAIANDRLEVAEFLITKGASLEVRNKQGMLPMDYIRSSAAKEQILMAASIAQENRETRMANTSHVTRVTSIKPKRILCTGLTTTEMKSLERCAKMLNAKIVNQFDEQVTHIVSAVNENNLCSRTMKYLLGLLTGKWIVSSLWVEECLKLKTWVNEDDFEVKGCPDADEYTPRKSRLNAAKQFPGLFDGCSFYFSGEFKSAPPKAELLELIRLGGGLILHREPKVETAHPLITPASPAVMKMMSSRSVEVPSVAYHAKPNTAQSHCTQYVLFDEGVSPDHKRISTPIMCTAPTRWLMDCVSKFEILEVKDI